jgi:hypothetical protein
LAWLFANLERGVLRFSLFFVIDIFKAAGCRGPAKNTGPNIYMQARSRNFPSGGEIVEGFFVIGG